MTRKGRASHLISLSSRVDHAYSYIPSERPCAVCRHGLALLKRQRGSYPRTVIRLKRTSTADRAVSTEITNALVQRGITVLLGCLGTIIQACERPSLNLRTEISDVAF